MIMPRILKMRPVWAKIAKPAPKARKRKVR